MPTASRQRIPLPFELGYFLVSPTLETRGAERNRNYKGIDRLLYLPFDVDGEVEIAGGRASEYLTILDSFGEVEHGLLRVDLQTATNFSHLFGRLGFPNEVVYSNIVSVPECPEMFPRGHQWPDSLREGLLRRSTNHEKLARQTIRQTSRFSGFDVSLPIHSFHSILVNPGLPEFDETFRPRLNSVGLFSDLTDAEQCMDAANYIAYSDLPFCVLAVYDQLSFGNAK